MFVVHETIKKNQWSEIVLPVKTGAVSVKNTTNGDIKVSIGKMDPENYVTIKKGDREELYHCLTSSSCPCNFFSRVYVYSGAGGTVEIRCLKI